MFAICNNNTKHFIGTWCFPIVPSFIEYSCLEMVLSWKFLDLGQRQFIELLLVIPVSFKVIWNQIQSWHRHHCLTTPNYSTEMLMNEIEKVELHPSLNSCHGMIEGTCGQRLRRMTGLIIKKLRILRTGPRANFHIHISLVVWRVVVSLASWPPSSHSVFVRNAFTTANPL